MKLDIRIRNKTLLCFDIEPEAFKRSRATLLVRRRTAKKLTREDLAERTGLEERFIERVEKGYTLWPNPDDLNLLEDELELKSGSLLIPPAAVERCLAGMANVLKEEGRIYGGAYAKKFNDLYQPAADFASQIADGIARLWGNEAKEWLEDLYAGAHKIRAVAVPPFLFRATASEHWNHLIRNNSTKASRDIQRIYILGNGTATDRRWQKAFESDPADKRTIDEDTAKSILNSTLDELKRKTGKHASLASTLNEAERAVVTAADGDVFYPLDFSIVDDAVIGLTIDHPQKREMGSVFHFGNLALAEEYRRLFSAFWKEAHSGSPSIRKNFRRQAARPTAVKNCS
jgi:transcriptional regulator with XRE-family HTH domain